MNGCWQRLGRLDLDSSGASSWAVTHAALPALEPVADGRWHLYLSLRDVSGRSRIGRTTLTLDPGPALAPLEPQPVLDLGERGTFDDSGVVSSQIAVVDDRRLLFYTGWSRGVTVPFYLGAGLAVSERGGPFQRVSRAPLLERCDEEPFQTASPFVLRDGERWRMWYVSGAGWMHEPADEPCYSLRYTESADGIHWARPGRGCLDSVPRHCVSDEHAFGRPWVLRDDDRYRMWFPVRGRRYRIGYAESPDGIRWVRDDERGGLAPSETGWDSEMVAYPCVLEHRGRRYMLYNGNDYGRTGVGIAVWMPDVASPL